jgi:hypothetical protein
MTPPASLRLAVLALVLHACDRPPPRTVELNALARGAGAFVAVGTQEREEKIQGLVLRSGDGQTWSEVTLAAPGPLVMLAEGGPGLVAVGSYTPEAREGAAAPGPAGLVMLSSDGVRWEAAASPPGPPLLDVAANREGLVAVARRSLYWSSDGRVWLQQPVGSADDETWSQVEASDGRFVALGRRPAVSSDGRSWQPVTTIPEGELRGLRSTGGAFYSTGRVGGFFGGVGEDGCVLLRSEDGAQWAPVDGAAPGCALDVARTDQQALLLSSKGVFEATSFAGPWSLRSSLEGAQPLRMESGAGRWVIAARDALWTSADGKIWNRTFAP